MTRETTKTRCYNFLAMNCDVALKTKACGLFDWKTAHRDAEVRISLLCQILKIDESNLNYYETIKKYRPDLFEQNFYDDMRKYVK